MIRAKYQAALECFDAVLQENSQHPMALYYKVFALLGLRRFREAFDWCRHAFRTRYFQDKPGKKSDREMEHFFAYQDLESYAWLN